MLRYIERIKLISDEVLNEMLKQYIWEQSNGLGHYTEKIRVIKEELNRRLYIYEYRQVQRKNKGM